MTFGEKLKKLRTDYELTQDELAQALYVSRTAISKWESGRGYPNIESLKAISKQFSISIDDMLSGDEVISIAEQDQKQKKMRTKDILFGAFDCSEILLLFLPFFSQKIDGVICGTDLLNLTDIQPYLKITFFVTIILSIIIGVMILVLQNCNNKFWLNSKTYLSLINTVIGVVLFIISKQPYAAIFIFVFLIIKSILIIKKK